MTDALRCQPAAAPIPPPSLEPPPPASACFSLAPPSSPPASPSLSSPTPPWVLHLPSELPDTLATAGSCAAGLWYALRNGAEWRQPAVAKGADGLAQRINELVFRSPQRATPPEPILAALRSIGAEQGTDGIWRLARGKWYEAFPRFALAPGFAGRTAEVVGETDGWSERKEHEPDTQPITSHPARSPQTSYPVHPSLLYSRWIPWLSSYLCLSIYPSPTDPQWLTLLHGWLNDPRVDAFWKDSGSLAFHKDWLRERYDDPHVLPVLGRFQSPGSEETGEPFGYFEIYWAAEDKIGKYYPAQPYDRGLHMLVGSQDHRGPHRVSAWLPSLVHYAFASDDRTQRVVSEPDRRNAKMVGYLEAFGFRKDKEVDVGNKVAALMILERGTFYELCPL